MTDAAIYSQGWQLDEILWAAFDAARAEPWLISAIKSAALVELNAPDYVAYLKRVFSDADAAMIAAIEQWGREETQHGRALGCWAEMADPTFKLQEAFARLRAGYRPRHFELNDDTSVRGSRRGEMISRCVVESGTSSYYSAIRDATDEPLLKEIAGRIAADEYRHYKLFFETLKAQDEPDLPFWKKLLVALGRITESDDDEISYAYYCANVVPADMKGTPYNRKQCARLAASTLMRIYRRNHIQRLVQMIAKVVGVAPQGRATKLAAALLWRALRWRADGATALSA